MREGDFTFPRRDFFVSQCRKILLGTLPRPRKFPVAKTFYGCEGGYQVFPWKKLSITVPESFIGNASWFEKVLVFEEIYGQDGGYLKVLSKLWSHVTEKIFGNSSGFQRNSGSKKFVWMREGDIRFCGWFFCLTLPKTILWVQFHFSQSFWQRKHVLDPRRISRSPVETFWSHTSENFIWELFRCFKIFLSAKSLYGWEKGISRFSVENFWITVPENLIGKSSWFQTLSRMGRNVWTNRG